MNNKIWILLGIILILGVGIFLKMERQDNAVLIVQKNLEALKNNDFEEWEKTYWKGEDGSLNKFEEQDNLGVIALEIQEVKISEKETERIKEMYIGSELAKSYGWSQEYLSKNMMAVLAKYEVDYDNVKVSYNEGELAWYFYLIREDEDSPWLIWDRMGTAFDTSE